MDGDQSHLGAMKVKPLAGTKSFIGKVWRSNTTLQISGVGLIPIWLPTTCVVTLPSFLWDLTWVSLTGRVSNGPITISAKSGFKVEVKSAAYLQTWKQSRCSTISFGGCANQIIQRHNRQEERSLSAARILYVFCLLAQRQINGSLEHGSMAVLCAGNRRMDAALGAQESLSLSRLMKLGPIQCTYGGISVPSTRRWIRFEVGWHGKPVQVAGRVSPEGAVKFYVATK
jgi:hypothetical protein